MSQHSQPSETSSEPAKRVSKNLSSGVKVSGLYRRGQVWWWNRQDSGHRVRLSLETTDHATAVRKVLEYRAKPHISEVGRWEYEVNRYLDDQRERGRLSPSYSKSRRYVLMRFAKDAGIDSPREVNVSLIQRWYDDLKAQNGDTAKHYVVHVRVFLSHLVERHRLHENPAAKVRFDKTLQRTRDVFIPREEVARLIDEAPNNDLRLILLLGFECGMRKQEIISARPAWLDIPTGTISIPSQEEGFIRKNRKSTTIPMTERVRGFLAAGSWPGPFLLRPDIATGSWRYRYDFRKSFDAYMKAKDYGHVTVHDMRRSFASNRVSAGVSIEKVSNWLGDTIQVAWKNYSRFLPVDSDINLGAA
jgi:integrase